MSSEFTFRKALVKELVLGPSLAPNAKEATTPPPLTLQAILDAVALVGTQLRLLGESGTPMAAAAARCSASFARSVEAAQALTKMSDPLALLEVVGPLVMRVVLLASQCAGLLLNLAKCQVVHLYEMSDDNFAALFKTVRMNVRSLKHGTCGKVLGVFLGPGGYLKTWEEPGVPDFASWQDPAQTCVGALSGV